MADDAKSEESTHLEAAPDHGLVFADEASASDGDEPKWAGSPDEGPRLSEEEKARILAPRVEVKRPEWAPLPTEVLSYCPGCKAKNHMNAALCGLCGVEIPMAIPDGVGASKRGRNVARKTFEGDLYVPDEVQERLDERRAEQDERVEAREARYSWRRWSVTLGGGLFFGVLGGGVNFSFYGILFDPSLLERFVIATVISAFAGLYVGRRLFKQGGGRITGTILYGAAAVVSVGAMMILGGYRVFGPHDSTLTGGLAGALFIFPICFLLGSMCLGSMMGLSIELQNSDD